ncbi:MAG: hypothetical protein IKD73_02775 [Selenomonadaceae bacterium]|nr:hypothetical protein [Selenomonadaceae bacterium]
MSYEIIPQAPRYEMSNMSLIRNRETGKVLKSSGFTSGQSITGARLQKKIST